MSQNADTDRNQDAQSDESSPAPSTGADDDADQPLDWAAAADAFQRQQEQRRTVGVEVPDAGVAEFTLRGLTRKERDDVEQSAATVQQTGRGEPEVDVDTGVIRRKMLEYGIVEGPDGFDPSRADHVDALPPGVQDELVDIVEEMSSLTVEERDGFQKVG